VNGGYGLIVFDWDGTLMDSAACIAASLQAACRDLGFRVPNERDARYVIGLGLADAMAHVLPDLAPSEYPRVKLAHAIIAARPVGTNVPRIHR
jgi:phosphoglycolate phosphatase